MDDVYADAGFDVVDDDDDDDDVNTHMIGIHQ